MEIVSCKFTIGQVIQHRLFDYRGVIFDIDATFQGTDEWYEQMAKSKPPKDKPWYHVLVHGAFHTTYVAEQNLEKELSGLPIEHPILTHFFEYFQNGQYIPIVN
ncbi:MAG: heat shock protein HspQ [SAR324 cluster bacterium]|nr:heat shock protein HspQ [SAR324 cluster bacterium]